MRLSPDDERFRRAFERGDIAPAAFDHRAHVRLAYAYLAGRETGEAERLMRKALLDPRVMMTHYSARLLFSEEARAGFVAADLDPIPSREEPGAG